MPNHLPVLDTAILLGYLLAVVGLGCGFIRKSRTAESFMAAGRSLPGWAVGASIFGSYVSSISFLANPGKAYAENWNPFVFAVSLPVAAWVSTRYFVPFYRRRGEVSAYQHLENRFGVWARTYAVTCYLLTQVARLGTILYLLALALAPLWNLDVATVIVISGVVVTIYPLLGGTEGVIWTGVVQAVVLVLGAVACLVLILVRMPAGAGQVFDLAVQHDKFSLGSRQWTLAAPTIGVVLGYGLVTNLQNFGIDQSYIQRYITAKSDRAAALSVWMGALLYMPLSAVFLFIGTALFAFYQAQPGLLPSGTAADKVFPHFIGTQLGPGLAGLVLAAICSAAMDSNLNCCATLFLCDVYRRFLRPAASDRESMRVLRLATLAMGTVSTAAALAMMRVKSALDAWWELAGALGGGMLGLFLLGMMVRRAGRGAALTGVVAGVSIILWMTWSPTSYWPDAWASWRSPLHGFTTIMFGTVTILVTGTLVSRFRAKVLPTSPSR
jgi:SSS family solute:Na+ symporter